VHKRKEGGRETCALEIHCCKDLFLLHRRKDSPKKRGGSTDLGKKVRETGEVSRGECITISYRRAKEKKKRSVGHDTRDRVSFD